MNLLRVGKFISGICFCIDHDYYACKYLVYLYLIFQIYIYILHDNSILTLVKHVMWVLNYVYNELSGYLERFGVKSVSVFSRLEGTPAATNHSKGLFMSLAF